MIKDSRFSQEVKIETVKEKTGRTSVKNPHAVSNVNVAQGPRTGNNEAQGKRNAFKSAKEDRAPLAKVIQDAYAKRQHEYQDYEYTNGGSIMDNVNEGPRKKRK
jgi:hypothetical protein